MMRSVSASAVLSILESAMSPDPSPEVGPEHIKDLQSLAPLIGEINMTWGDIQSLIFMAFVHLLKGDGARGQTIFFALKTDRAQRDITLALAMLVIVDDQ